jgi:predicted SnoaL-like aldol condensation-catalyzing enzyme
MSGQTNKELVKAFTRIAFVEKRVREAAERYLPVDYVNHHPDVSDGREAFIEAVGGLFDEFPDTRYEIRRMIAERDLVVVHTHLQPTPGKPGLAIVDIFRVDGEKVVEHWEVDQEVSSPAAADKMF